MRATTWLLAAALAAPVSAPAPALAQPDQRTAVEACRPAISREVRDQFPQAYGVRLLEAVPVAQGRGEVAVTGHGEFDDRNGGAARFDFACTYDRRSGAAYGLDVTNVRPKGEPGGKKDNSAAIAGLVLGAIVVGALVAAADDDDDDRRRRRDDVWSPAPGVRCSAREARCYENGRYSRRWTSRIFVR